MLPNTHEFLQVRAPTKAGIVVRRGQGLDKQAQGEMDFPTVAISDSDMDSIPSQSIFVLTHQGKQAGRNNIWMSQGNYEKEWFFGFCECLLQSIKAVEKLRGAPSMVFSE